MPDDQLPFTLNDHDVRVQMGTWVYYVRAVHRGESLLGGGSVVDLGSAVVLVMLASAFGRAIERWQRRQPWTVGVIRMRGDSWGANGVGRIKVVHKEFVAGASVPTARLEELRDRVRAGDFAD